MLEDYQTLKKELLNSWEYISDLESFLKEAPMGRQLTVSEIIKLYGYIKCIREFDEEYSLTELAKEECCLGTSQSMIENHMNDIENAVEIAIRAGLIYYGEPRLIGWSEVSVTEELKRWKTLPSHIPNINIHNDAQLIHNILRQLPCASLINYSELTINSATIVLVFESHMITYSHKVVETEFELFDGPDDEPTSRPMYLTYHLRELSNEVIDEITIGIPIQILCY